MAVERTTLGLDKIRIKKSKLVEKMKENLEKHTAKVEEATAVWRDSVIEKMKANLAAFEAGTSEELNIDLMKPEDYSKSYINVIKMLEASADEEVIISQRDFLRYHEDEWEWKNLYADLADTYSAAPSRIRGWDRVQER